MSTLFCVFILVVVAPLESRYLQDEANLFRISGGTAAQMHEFPYMAGLLHLDQLPFCGGALISDLYVLTAAHCVVHKLPSNILVRLGDYDTSIVNETNHVDIHVSKVIPHENFNSLTTSHDLALVKLETTPKSLFIRTICLSTLTKDYDGEKAVIAGWGSTSGGGDLLNVLHKLQMFLLSQRRCHQLIDDHYKFLSQQQICAWNDDTGPCRHDSGGPLVVRNAKKIDQLVGIISLGKCDQHNLPAIFTRVSSYLDWIQENTRDDNSICWS